MDSKGWPAAVLLPGSGLVPGAAVFASQNRLSVQKPWAYAVEGEAPKRVILNNGGQDTPYPTSEQIADGLLRLRVRGWNGVPLKLRLEDPPDYSPYVPWGTWTPKPGKTAAPPYVANDNEVWTEDPLPAFGLSASSSGPFAQELTVTPSGNHTAVFYDLGREGFSPSRPALGWAKPTAAKRKRKRRRGFALAAHPSPLRSGPLLRSDVSCPEQKTAAAVRGGQLARGGLQDRPQDRPGGAEPTPPPARPSTPAGSGSSSKRTGCFGGGICWMPT